MDPGPQGGTELVASFLAAHDAACPACGYNLRGSRSDKCPECACPVELFIRRVGDASLREHRHWLFILIVFLWVAVGAWADAVGYWMWLFKFAPQLNSNSPLAGGGLPVGAVIEYAIRSLIDVVFAVLATAALVAALRYRRRPVSLRRARRIFRFAVRLAIAYAVAWGVMLLWSWLFPWW